MTKKYYQILEINEDATQAEIKKAYYRLAFKWHPDKNLNNKEQAEKKFKEINNAYGVLGSEELRKRYDAGETNFTTDYGSEQERAFWEEKEEKLKEEIKIMEELAKTEKERQEALKKIWLLNAEYLERWDTWFDISNAFFTTYPRVFKEDLDNKIWETYQDWLDKVWKMPIELKRKEKEHSEELRQFKEEIIRATKEAETVLKNKEKEKQDNRKNRANDKIGREKSNAIETIETLINEEGLREQDLGEYSKYQDQIDNLKKTREIRELRDKILESIYKLKDRKNDDKQDKQDKPVDIDKIKQTFNQSQNQDEWNQEKEKLLKQIEDLENENNQGKSNKEFNNLKQLVHRLEKEVQELRTEIQELKKEKYNSYKYQVYLNKKESQLKDKEQKLKELKGIISDNKKVLKTEPNKFPTGLVIGGVVGLVAIVALVGLMVKRSKSKRE